jgi:DNA-binding CsgD family transcriptional regulator
MMRRGLEGLHEEIAGDFERYSRSEIDKPGTSQLRRVLRRDYWRRDRAATYAARQWCRLLSDPALRARYRAHWRRYGARQRALLGAPRRAPDLTVATIQRLRAEGLSLAAIGLRFGIARQAVHSRLKQGAPRLVDVEYVRQRRAEGASQREIARELGIEEASLSRLLSRGQRVRLPKDREDPLAEARAAIARLTAQRQRRNQIALDFPLKGASR